MNIAEATVQIEGAIKAYCIEFDVNIQFGSDLKVGSWKEFPGTNKFKDNPDVQAKVAWIAQKQHDCVYRDAHDIDEQYRKHARQ